MTEQKKADVEMKDASQIETSTKPTDEKKQPEPADPFFGKLKHIFIDIQVFIGSK
jgi:hypothetical protein